jgi:hypothetical protein
MSGRRHHPAEVTTAIRRCRILGSWERISHCDESRDQQEEDVFAAEWGVGQVLWSIIWFTLFFIWIWLLITVFADIFKSHDLSGVAKFLWVAFVILAPYLGVFVYLIARGHTMARHATEEAQAMDAAQRAYIQEAAGTVSSPTAELERLADLRSSGAIDQSEFDRLKAKVVGA